MSTKLFAVAGVSISSKGEMKVRFANDMTRVKVLAKTDSDINLLELPKEMTKPEAVSFLKTTELYQTPSYQAAIDAADVKYNGTNTVKVSGAKVRSSQAQAVAETA
jgi:hypothetical protein